MTLAWGDSGKRICKSITTEAFFAGVCIIK